jgi:hypothetical protein
MKRVKYKGFVVEAQPLPLVGGRWDLRVFIERHTGDSVLVTQYSAANTFSTEQEAAQHCIAFGQQIINGNVTGCTPP